MRDDGRIELGRLNLGWNDTRTEHLLARVKLRIGRRARVRRAVLASTALTSVACIAAFALRPSPSSNGASPAVSAVAPALIRLGDGSEIRVDPTGSEVRVVEEQPSRVRVEAIRGRAHYSVVPNPGRSFEVASGSVTVRVVGTEFQVERREDKTFVEVSRGKVEVVGTAAPVASSSRPARAGPSRARPNRSRSMRVCDLTTTRVRNLRRWPTVLASAATTSAARTPSSRGIPRWRATP